MQVLSVELFAQHGIRVCDKAVAKLRETCRMEVDDGHDEAQEKRHRPR
jgi:hypothetical protein